ncbi:MAG: nucleoside triphosphate pyrophosphohydrolase [Muribaculaceae bacterium]|nr:nucleoside triphosphate pyrophosphohydrolase [Muribaculaceae bacterium]MEE1297749.1 nucleoside triphosphate pyrophosphohydrolase [Muribaculaceae bacterium]
MSHSKEEKLRAFSEILDVLDTLRVKCPWDAKQTNESLRPNSVEEMLELADALIRDDVQDIKKELGDVLLHVLFYSRIADEQQRFDIADVCDALTKKLIFRHPHVYGTAAVEGTDDVLKNWEELKLKEKDGNKTVLSGVPSALPALIKAFRVQEKTANVGFDWDSPEEVWNKVKEEIAEVETEIKNGNAVDVEKEFGDLLFSVVNVARKYGVNPENALEKTNQKFISRFNYVEAKSKEQGKRLKEMTLDEMDVLWDEAKRNENTAQR